MLNIEIVRNALARYETAHARATDAQKPRIDAKRSILRADLRDRTLGLTFNAEKTPGLAIASLVK